MKRVKAKSKTSLKPGSIISIREANELTNWIAGKKKRCGVCGGKTEYYTRTETIDAVCRNCCESAIEKELISSKAGEWQRNRIEVALSQNGLIVERLAVLTHMEMIQHRMDLRELLIDNLGFSSNHPLSHEVRQKAFTACETYHHKQAMFRSLAKTFQYANWQHQVNITKLCFYFSPDDTRSKMKCTETATSSSPSARIHMAELVSHVDTPWAQKIWDNLCRDANPLVRETCQDIAKQNRKKIKPFSRFSKSSDFVQPKTAHRSKVKPVSFFGFEKSLNNTFSFKKIPYKKVYTQYLKDLLEFMDPAIIGEKELQQMSSDFHVGFVKLLAAALSNKTMFEKLLKILPAEVGVLIYYCTWEEFHFVTKEQLQALSDCLKAKTSGNVEKEKEGMEKMDPFMQDSHGIGGDAYFAVEAPPEELFFLIGEPFSVRVDWDVELIQNPAFFLFQIERKWQTTLSTSGFILSIKPLIQKRLRQLMPAPPFNTITYVDAVDSKKYTLHKNGSIFEKLPTILAFIAQDNLEFSKRGDKIKVGSLRKMADICGIEEYYPDGPPPLRDIKTKLLAEFFISGTSKKDKSEDELPKFLKKKILQYLEYKDYRTFRCRDLLEHIKRKQDECHEDDDERAIRNSFMILLKMLSETSWVFVENLVKSVRYRELPLSPFTHRSECDSLHLEISPEIYHRYPPDYFSFSCNSGSSSIHENGYDTVAVPLVKTVLFLFSALHVVEVAYGEAKNDILYLFEKNYLTVYDGLTYVRLTDFGAYVLGLKESYTASVEKKSAEIIIDEGRLMLSIIGDDPIKQLSLETVGRQMTGSSYIVDYHSFLRECATRQDVENRIDYFRTHISKNPPAIWEAFFQSVRARMNPLKSVGGMMVFKVEPDRELITHLTTDPILKAHVIKAENYHLLIPRKAYPTVKKVLKQLGYFLS